MASEIAVAGWAELNAQLDRFALDIQKKALRGALRAGMKITRAEVQRRVPVGDTPQEFKTKFGSYAGALRDSIKITSRVSRRTGQVFVNLRVGDKKAFYARWVEFGTAAHVIRAANGKALSWGDIAVPLVNHPGTKPTQFMRNSIDATLQLASDAVVAELRKRVTKELSKLPDEVDE